MDIVIGTAGHIDHGKTALVKALTGIDADRLPEEKQRGITIDLGFAELAIDGLHIGFVDVPGHERFVKNMLAGASGIDLVLLIIAADEGVMPQTREHFDICRLLEVGSGIVAITKCDLVDAEILDLIRLDVVELTNGSFLENSAVIAVSSRSGEGIDELKREIAKAAGQIKQRSQDRATFLPIDRSFAVKGFGTVVTGTLASGTIKVGDDLELLPVSKKVRVRGLQSHGTSVEEVGAGRRVAVNLGGIDHDEVVRGNVLAELGIFRTTQIVNAQLELLETSKRSLRSRQRVRVHLGTIEALARVRVFNEIGEIEPGSRDFIQISFETEVAARLGDRFIIRSYSPQITIGGGFIVDPLADKVRTIDLARSRVALGRMAPDSSIGQVIRNYVDLAGQKGISESDLRAKTGWRSDLLRSALDSASKTDLVVKAGETYLPALAFEEMKAELLDRLSVHHKTETLSKGMSREALRGKRMSNNVFETLIARLNNEKRIEVTGDIVTLAARKAELTDEEQVVKNRLTDTLKKAGVLVPKFDELIAAAVKGTKVSHTHALKILRLLFDSGEVIKISEDFVFAGNVIRTLIATLQAYASTGGDRTIDVPKFKELAGVSRKYAIPILEYLDREKITIRMGDKRIIR